MPRRFAQEVTPALREVVERVLPGARILEVVPLSEDEAGGGTEPTRKGAGYGVPLALRVRCAGGDEQRLVFHVAKADRFGHDRRADRAAELILAFDSFGEVPRHVQALDVGAIRADGPGLVSLAHAGEFYLLTRYAPGRPYADDLRRVVHTGRLGPDDVPRSEALARYLAQLHRRRLDAPVRWERAVRDLVGSGEGIFGIVDGYPPGAPGAPPERLAAIEDACVARRRRLRGRVSRLARIHGDFHPFNVLFDRGTELQVLDAARGCAGEPGDDLTAMAVNYPFFAAEAPEAWPGLLQTLWRRFWETYLAETGDDEVLEMVAPWLAWRGLVVANPVWYPALPAEARDRVLRLVERALAADRFDPGFADEVFR